MVDENNLLPYLHLHATSRMCPLHCHVTKHQVSSKMESGEFVYLICQNVRSGRVLTVADRRDDVTSEEADPAAEGSWGLGKYVPFLQK